MAQRNMLLVFEIVAPGDLDMPCAVRVPAGRTLADVEDAFRRLVLRNESLRTRYRPGAEPRQTVVGTGELVLPVYEIGADPEDVIRGIYETLLARRTAGDGGFPFGAAVVTRDGRPTNVVLAVSHIAADGHSMNLLRAQLQASLERPSDVAAPDPGRTRQPIDHAEAERGQTGRWTAAAVRHWETVLTRSPQAMFAEPDRAVPPTADPFVHMGMRSVAVAAAARTIAARAGVTPSTVVLAAVMVLVAHHSALDGCVVVSQAANRLHPDLYGYVGCLAQDALIGADLSVDTFDEALRRVWHAAQTGYRNARYEAHPIWTVVDRIRETRGTWFARDFLFSDLRTLRTPASSVAPQGTPQILDELVARTEVFEVRKWAVYERLAFLVHGLDAEADVSVQVDQRRLGAGDAEAFLRGVERLLVAAARREVRRAELGALTGVAVAVRDEHWRLIESSWIDLRAVERILRATAQARVAKVFEVPGPSGAARLEAFLDTDDPSTTPEQVHAGVVAVLPDYDTVMAPHRYTLCATAPADPDVHEWWRAQPVVRQGEGRLGQVRDS
jgi:hypothetical protein